MVDFGKSDKMIKISGKVDKPTLIMDIAFLIFCSLLKKELLQNYFNYFTILLFYIGIC